jgi:hypothetical protein
LSITAKVGSFLAAVEALLKCYEENIFLMSCLNRFRYILKKNTIFMPFYGDILQANFFDLKNSINRQNNGDLEPLKGFVICFFHVNQRHIYNSRFVFI